MVTKPQASARPGKKTLAATIGAAAAAALVALTASQEGVRLKPYNDSIANNVQTVCFGETNVQMRTYTLPECKSMLSDSLAGYADEVRSVTPGFDTLTDGQKVAVIDLTYNIGLSNYKASTLRKRYVARDFPGACDEFLKWRFVAGKDCAVASSNCPGIVKRRQRERDACMGA